MRISVRYDDSEIRRALLTLRSDAPLAIARALNRSIRTVRTQAVRDIAANVGLVQKVVRPVLGMKLASRDDLVATLEVTGKRIPLIKFGANQTAAGVSYRLPGGRGFVQSAFKATMPSGHLGVFKRTTTHRLPIRQLYGPSLPHVMASVAIQRALIEVAQAVMPKNLAHETEYLLRGRAAA